MEITPIDLTILSFCTLTIAYYTTSEAGPFGVFSKLRKLVGVREDIQIEAVPDLSSILDGQTPQEVKVDFEYEPAGLSELFTCPYCFAPYAASVAIILWAYFWPVAVILALAGVSMFLTKVSGLGE